MHQLVPVWQSLALRVVSLACLLALVRCVLMQTTTSVKAVYCSLTKLAADKSLILSLVDREIERVMQVLPAAEKQPTNWAIPALVTAIVEGLAQSLHPATSPTSCAESRFDA